VSARFASARGRGGRCSPVWYVYVARCGDGTLYTGVTTDVARRLREHREGRGAKYTRGRGGVRLRYCEPQPTHGRALSREAAIKRLRRAEKLMLRGEA
jgi:predicted GIY-YIG superfamily endonuclease